MTDMATTGSKKSAVNVTVDGVTYMAGDEIPAEAVKKIDNPKVWGKSESSDDSETKGN